MLPGMMWRLTHTFMFIRGKKLVFQIPLPYDYSLNDFS